VFEFTEFGLANWHQSQSAHPTTMNGSAAIERIDGADNNGDEEIDDNGDEENTMMMMTTKMMKMRMI
jgi:hypothetical protein